MDKAVFAVCLQNAVSVICWTFLAWHFDKWWIALLAALFMTSIKEKEENGGQSE